MCPLGTSNSKIANSMKLVNFAFFSSQYHVFELKNIRGNLIAPNSNRLSLSNENAMSQENYRKIISLFGKKNKYFSSSMAAERLDIILQIVGSNMYE